MSRSAKPAEDVTERVGHRLKQAQNALRTRMDAALRPLGITSPQYAVLAGIGASDCCVRGEGQMTELGRADFDCDGFPTAIDLGKLIDHLFAGGDGPCDPCAL